MLPPELWRHVFSWIAWYEMPRGSSLYDIYPTHLPSRTSPFDYRLLECDRTLIMLKKIEKAKQQLITLAAVCSEFKNVFQMTPAFKECLLAMGMMRCKCEQIQLLVSCEIPEIQTLQYEIEPFERKRIRVYHTFHFLTPTDFAAGHHGVQLRSFLAAQFFPRWYPIKFTNATKLLPRENRCVSVDLHCYSDLRSFGDFEEGCEYDVVLNVSLELDLKDDEVIVTIDNVFKDRHRFCALVRKRARRIIFTKDDECIPYNDPDPKIKREEVIMTKDDAAVLIAHFGSAVINGRHIAFDRVPQNKLETFPF
jgi:hypothetical protein